MNQEKRQLAERNNLLSEEIETLTQILEESNFKLVRMEGEISGLKSLAHSNEVSCKKLKQIFFFNKIILSLLFGIIKMNSSHRSRFLIYRYIFFIAIYIE